MRKILFNQSIVGLILAIFLNCNISFVEAEEYRYRFINMDSKVRPNYDHFNVSSINDRGQIVGDVLKFVDGAFIERIAVYQDGHVKILQTGFGQIINSKGVIAGAIQPDINDPSKIQAAIFKGNKVEPIPLPQDAVSSFMVGYTDTNVALLQMFNGFSIPLTFATYENGHLVPFDLGTAFPAAFPRGINNKKTIVGGYQPSSGLGNFNGFRFEHATGKTIKLSDPFPSGPFTETWGLKVNEKGVILGFSHDYFTSQEQVGVWDTSNNFKTYFTNQTLYLASAVINDKNQVAITGYIDPGFTQFTSYFVPKYGVRLKLIDLIENPPKDLVIYSVNEINNHGDMVGFSSAGNYFLKRIDD